MSAFVCTSCEVLWSAIEKGYAFCSLTIDAERYTSFVKDNAPVQFVFCRLISANKYFLILQYSSGVVTARSGFSPYNSQKFFKQCGQIKTNSTCLDIFKYVLKVSKMKTIWLNVWREWSFSSVVVGCTQYSGDYGWWQRNAITQVRGYIYWNLFFPSDSSHVCWVRRRGWGLRCGTSHKGWSTWLLSSSMSVTDTGMLGLLTVRCILASLVCMQLWLLLHGQVSTPVLVSYLNTNLSVLCAPSPHWHIHVTIAFYRGRCPING